MVSGVNKWLLWGSYSDNISTWVPSLSGRKSGKHLIHDVSRDGLICSRPFHLMNQLYVTLEQELQPGIIAGYMTAFALYWLF